MAPPLLPYRRSMIPSEALPELQAYIENGMLPRSFLQAVVSNNLYRMLISGSAHERGLVSAWTWWLRQNAPPASYGSLAKMQAWVETGGLYGRALLGLGDGAGRPASAWLNSRRNR